MITRRIHPELSERVNCKYRAVVEPHLLARSPYCNPDFFVRTEEQKARGLLGPHPAGFAQGRRPAGAEQGLVLCQAAADTNTFSREGQETYGGDIVDNKQNLRIYVLAAGSPS